MTPLNDHIWGSKIEAVLAIMGYLILQTFLAF
jgi:uncharacterized membrane protein